jgi:hypothetical protein
MIKWNKYPDVKPERECRCIVHAYGYFGKDVVEFYYLGGYCGFGDCDEYVTHWAEINLPE